MWRDVAKAGMRYSACVATCAAVNKLPSQTPSTGFLVNGKNSAQLTYLLAKFTRESVKKPCFTQCAQGGEMSYIVVRDRFFLQLVWQNGEDKNNMNATKN